MQIRVKLYTILKHYGVGKIDPNGGLELPENQTLQGLCEQLEIPRKLGKVFLVNGRPRREWWVLSDGDKVQLFAFIGGG